MGKLVGAGRLLRVASRAATVGLTPMTTPSDTQSLILSRAATRPGNLALPLPEGLVGTTAKMVVGKMIASGWLEEGEANLRHGEPMWR